MTALFFCLGLLLSAILAPLTVEAAEYRILPSMIVSEEYTDNAYLVPQSANPVSDWVTRLAPGVQMTYKAPLWDWEAAYTYDFRHHTESTFRPESNEKVPFAHLASLTRIVPEFLFLDIRDDYSRVSLNPTRDYTQESSFVNQTDRNVFSVSPYTTTRVSDRAMFQAGYLYRNTWYKDPQSIDTTDNQIYGEFKREMSQRTVVNGGIRYTKNENRLQSYVMTDIYTGQTYTYAEGSTFTATVGFSRFHFSLDDRTPREFYWDVREAHRFMSVTVLFETGRSYIPDPVQVVRRADRIVTTVRKDTDRTIVTASAGIWKYYDAFTNELENSSHRADTAMTYRVTTQTNVTGSLTMERLDDAIQRTRTRRQLIGLRMDQVASETLTWALDYRYGQADDHVVYLNNYRNNRFLVEMRKNF